MNSTNLGTTVVGCESRQCELGIQSEPEQCTHPHVSVYGFRHVVKCVGRILVVYFEKGSVLDIPGIKYIHQYGRRTDGADSGHFLSLSLSNQAKDTDRRSAIVYHKPGKVFSP